MCNSDTGLITYHWVKGNPVPYPDFNTLHYCRDPEEVLKWAKLKEAPITTHVIKHPGIIEMPLAP